MIGAMAPRAQLPAVLALFAAACSAAAPQARPAGGEASVGAAEAAFEVPPPPDDAAGWGIACRVNDEIITWKDVDDRLKLPAREITPEMRRSKRLQLAEESLFLQWARKSGIAVSEQEIDEQVRRDLKSSFAGSEERFESWLRSTGQTRTEYRQQWRRTLMEQKLYWHLVRKAVHNPDPSTPGIVQDYVTPEEIRRYYEEHRDQYRAIENVSYWRIAFQFSGAAERERKRALAESILRQVAGGADFYLLAHYYSEIWRTVKDGENARREYGDRGLKREDALKFYSPETVKLLFETMKVGEVSGIVEEGQTLNIFRLEQRINQREETFEEAQVKIRRFLEHRKREEGRRRLRDELVRRSYIWPPGLFEGR